MKPKKASDLETFSAEERRAGRPGRGTGRHHRFGVNEPTESSDPSPPRPNPSRIGAETPLGDLTGSSLLCFCTTRRRTTL